MKIKVATGYLLYFLLTVIIISSPALYNGYPVMHYDSGSYIHQSVNLQDQATNAPGYSLFVRAFSWQFSLWPVVFAQGLMISLLIFAVINAVIQSRNKLGIHFLIVSILSLFTALGWVSSEIMADIFAPVSILTLFLALNDNSDLKTRIISLIVLFYSATTHFSIATIGAGILLVFILYRIFWDKRKFIPVIKKAAFPFLAIILGSLFISNYYLLTESSQKAKSIRHVIFIARLMETGILDEFLEKNCESNRYALCNYRDQFPNVPSAFVWDKKSPFFKTGSWENSKEEYNEIIHRIFTDPHYIAMFGYKGIISTIQQLCTFQLRILVLSKDAPGPLEMIRYKFKHEEKKFLISAQHYTDRVKLAALNSAYAILTGMSLLMVMLFLSGKETGKDQNLRLLSVILIAGVFSNAAVNGFFSNVVDRYQARVNWLVVLAGLIIIIKYFNEGWRFTRRNSEDADSPTGITQ